MRNLYEILDKLDIEITKETDTEIQAVCPVHYKVIGKYDNNPSWWINKSTGANICFSCQFKGSLFSLIGWVLDLYTTSGAVDYTAVTIWLNSNVEMSAESLEKAIKGAPKHITLPERLPMSEARLALFTDPPADALASRKITLTAAKYHGVLWNPKKETWIFPIRNAETEELMGWQEKGYREKTFKNQPIGVEKSATLFGVEHMRDDRVIVVESPLDVVRLTGLGIHGSVATYGASVSRWQLKLLRYSDRIIAAFDNPRFDAAGKKASDAILASAKAYGLELSFFNYGDSEAKDIGDMTDDEIREGLKNAKDRIYGEKAYV
jgi:Toprim-like